MTKFKLGDRVKCVKDHDNKITIINKVGKVIYAHNGIIGVEFDVNINGHDSHHGKYGHVWNFNRDGKCLIPEFTTWKDRYQK